MPDIYLNFGAGNPVKSWLNLDSSPFFIFPRAIHQLLVLLGISRSSSFTENNYNYMKFSESKKLPFKPSTVSAIYTSHVQEHLSVSENKYFFKEANRILKKGDVIRIIIPDLEKEISFDSAFFSLEKKLLTLPSELKQQKIRALLEAVHGFPSFHKTLFVKKEILRYFEDKWVVSLAKHYLDSKIDKEILKLVERKDRTQNALIFELTKK